MSAPTVDVRRAADRFHTELTWLDSWHSFSFGSHYQADNTHHGLLLVSNDDLVAPGWGFETHGHRDMEIVTWVLSGELEHRDSEGNHGLLYPGLAQRMSAGTGIQHSEKNPSTVEPVHFVQMWVQPDNAGVRPSYQQLDVNQALSAGELVLVASGARSDSAITIHQQQAALWAARVPGGGAVELPDDRHVHLFVALGWGALEDGEPLARGDAVRYTDAGGGRRFAAGADGAEILVWQSS